MLTVPRLYVSDTLTAGARLTGDSGRHHYLRGVLRRVLSDPIHLFNGRDGEWLARITSLGGHSLTLTVESQVRPQAAARMVSLVFALLKRDATDLVVQKATELGATTLFPVLTERTNTGRANLARLNSIARAAAEQSERLTVPVIHEPTRLQDLLAEWPPNDPIYAAVERRIAPLPPPAGAGSAALLVGPEGGFASCELEAALQYPFVTPVSLGPHVLRAETACIAGLTLLQASRLG